MRCLVIIPLLLAGCCIKSHAQNNTSPYSIIGIGDIEKSSFDRTSGMGHAGLALSSGKYMYQANPASYSSLDEHFFHFELAARYKSVSYAGQPVSDASQSQSSDLQFKKLALAIKIRPKWAVSVGLLPFSTTSYSFNTSKTIQGSNQDVAAYYEGSGGMNQFYIANSFAVTKHFSVGLQASYLFGQFLETENFLQNVADSALSTSRNIFIGSPLLKLGLQYKTKLGNNLKLSLGATASNQTNLNADYTLKVNDGNSVIVNQEYIKNKYFTLPAVYAGGIAATLKDAYTVAADYSYQGWSSLNAKGVSYALVNSNRISLGMEYSKKIHLQNLVYEKYFLQSGFFYDNSYLKIYGQQLKNYGITLGAGTQLARSGLGLQGGLEIGKRGTTNNGLIRENYTQFNITISYHDFWFTKMKRYN